MDIYNVALKDKLNLFEISILVQLEKNKNHFIRIEEISDDILTQNYIRKYIYGLVKKGYVMKHFSKYRINDFTLTCTNGQT
ncbi:hypothetical protein [Virgibacillus halodenitrificans]|jgi:predicted transcriptional regulator|uniref:hypothetical protein n=1 Tax=Virgibacillus halodenitrificans TaxID=1482 RepID=UPI00136EEF85|nr:hypothetical protein [Virgibacillus halodenitrificans]MCJ0930726.1 hypothetical protein [Virgibacillus halodenitrificans]MYL56318.1 hypothetical protein [Virgibacillus halodenitrificans]WHX27642.1 hypothetical protein QNH47_07260 [Virgibacillus halodenitrificans]